VRLVEVFQVDLRGDPAGFSGLLGPDEAAAAAGRRDGARWAVARGALRALLGERLGAAPERVALTAGPHGKPEVPGARLRFNVSHSGELAVIALADGFEVGVDVERLDRRSRAVERTLTAAERAALAGVADRHAALLRVWCRKEALAKAIGGGLGWEPLRFDTTQPGAYTLTEVAAPAGYVAALAWAGGPGEVVVRSLPDASEPGRTAGL
jgi:4'-phosphopantetheinyl transferase